MYQSEQIKAFWNCVSSFTVNSFIGLLVLYSILILLAIDIIDLIKCWDQFL